MSIAARLTLTLMMMLAVTAPVPAQESTPATTTATTTAADPAEAAPGAEAAPAETPADRERIYTGFRSILGRHPSDVGTVLALEPSLLSNAEFLQQYPDLQAYVARNPQIVRNPHYYLRGYGVSRPVERDGLEDVIEMLSIFFVISLIALALAWFIRTIIEQRRWNRLSRQQSEVHNKILDRFGSTEELLAYIRTPAGTKFLESAPIPVHTERTAPNAPSSRLMWSIQIGVVLAIAGLGMLLVSLRFDGGSAHGFFAMGVIAFCVGAGFVASALVSVLMSRRLGLFENTQAHEKPANDAGMMR